MLKPDRLSAVLFFLCIPTNLNNRRSSGGVFQAKGVLCKEKEQSSYNYFTVNKMKLFSLLLLSLGASIGAAGELVIDSTFKPEGCDTARKSVSGDNLSMHYTGKLTVKCLFI
jgi:hypothetical protein